MHNILILGCARSGTSTVSGVLGESNYWMGDSLWEGDSYNPKGYFEDSLLTAINEDILAPHMESPLARAGGDPDVLSAPSRGYWFGHLQPNVNPVVGDQVLLTRMAAHLSKQPYCLKDPQFCYTLGEWRQFLSNEKYVCAFRSPHATAASIVNMCDTQTFYKPCRIDMDYAYALWEMMYQHVLNKHAKIGSWLFLHYSQLFNDESLDELERFVGHRLNRPFAEKQLNKQSLTEDYPERLRPLYAELCGRAHFDA